MPVSYNRYELLHRPILGDLENGPKQQAIQVMWLLWFGAATNKRGIELAQNLADQNVGLTMHTNVIEGFARDGKLEELKRAVPFILAENEQAFRSPILKDKDAISEPPVIIERIVKRYGLSGILLGIDHLAQQGRDLVEVFDDELVRSNTKAMHLAGASSHLHHDVIAIGDEEFKGFLQTVATVPFAYPIRAALDYKPVIFNNVNPNQQVDLYKKTIDWIMSTQK